MTYIPIAKPCKVDHYIIQFLDYKVPTSASSTYRSAKPTGPPTYGLSNYQIWRPIYIAELAQQICDHFG